MAVPQAGRPGWSVLVMLVVLSPGRGRGARGHRWPGGSFEQYSRYGAPMGKANRVRYSKWDGTQVGFDLDATGIFEEITDDLLYHGDLNAALRRMMQSGFKDRNGEQMKGLREMLEELRRKRRETLEQHDLGGVYDDIAHDLRDVVEKERAALDDLAREARESGDARRQELTDEVAAERHASLDLLSPDLAGMVRELQSYDFTSSEAREQFEELVEKLREQLMQQYVDQMAGAIENMSPEDMARMKDMFAELNQMLEQRQRGEEPDFDGFMERFGDFFPENPRDLDELLEVMAQRMAAIQAMMNSMTPEQRAQLQALVRPAPRGHGPALADRPARPEPPGDVPRPGLEPSLRLLR